MTKKAIIKWTLQVALIGFLVLITLNHFNVNSKSIKVIALVIAFTIMHILYNRKY